MKRNIVLGLLALIVAVLVIAPSAGAQVSLVIKNDSTFINSQVDTMRIGVQKWTAATNIWVRGLWRDTVAVDLTFKARIRGDASWTSVTAATDSANYANTGSFYKGYTLRSPLIDRFPGLDVEWLVIATYRATGNGFLVDNKATLTWWIRN